MKSNVSGRVAKSVNSRKCDSELDPVSELKGKSRTMQRVRGQLKIEGASKGHVLLLGETGTGKELMARAIFETMRLRGLATGDMVAVSCATFGGDERMAESELFGHSKGAFTSAVGMRRGLIETAGRGVLFLDDLQDLPETVAAKLNRTMETGEYRRVGDDEIRKAECRFIAASNAASEQDDVQNRVYETLQEIVERCRVDAILKGDGQNVARDRVGDLIELFFAARGATAVVKAQKEDRPWGMRRDFFERFDGRIEMTPLRERLDDLVELFFEFLDDGCRRSGRETVKEIPLHIVVNLLAHDWPGNVRELKAGVERLIRYWDWEMQSNRWLFTDVERVWCMPAGEFWSLLIRLTGSAAYAYPMGPEAWYRILDIDRARIERAVEALVENGVESQQKISRLAIVRECIKEFEIDKVGRLSHLFEGEAAEILAEIKKRGARFWRLSRENGFWKYIELEDPDNQIPQAGPKTQSSTGGVRGDQVDWVALAKRGMKLQEVKRLYLQGLVEICAGNVAAAARLGGVSESTLRRMRDKSRK